MLSHRVEQVYSSGLSPGQRPKDITSNSVDYMVKVATAPCPYQNLKMQIFNLK